MSRRTALPGADELLRRPLPRSVPAVPEEPALRAVDPPAAPARERREEKITVYVSSAELVALERAKLDLRATYGVATDRGRIVREAVALALAGLDEQGAGSALVRRLSGDG